jgi:hypothetical protein
MKTIFIIISFFFITICHSQLFKNDWSAFKCENWSVEINEEKSLFLGKEIQGKVSFSNTKENSRAVNYYVYKKSDIDSGFQKELQHYLMIQSCIFLKGTFNFSSFYLKDYYYFVQPCHFCSTKENKDCENLAKHINKYIPKK